MQRAQQNNIKFIHADEAVFTFNTFIQKSWYKSHIELKYVTKKQRYKQCEFLKELARILVQKLMIFIFALLRESSIQNSYKKLREKQPQQEIILFVDNISVQKIKEIRKDYEQLRITPVFNVHYSPQFNGIEFY